MANLSETPEWVDNIYRIELDDPVEGGENGIDNRQAKQLGNRTQFLKQELESTQDTVEDHEQKIDQLLTADVNQAVVIQALMQRITALEQAEAPIVETVKIGQVITFDRHFETPAEVATYMGFGTWERSAEGRVVVGFSDDPNSPQDVRTFGAEFGEYETTLSTENLPSISFPDAVELTGSGKIDGYSSGAPQNDNYDLVPQDDFGSSEPFDRSQPSVTQDVWKRIA